ncbi:ABC transporter permease [Ralstonia sp. A12]|uniref:substrate-binding periplasmic protein n=1 Tax=Ralstonia sp. A12 TaxID=1217052 RepID=UPI00057584AD|nr:transporter substrate-binding domain-containing protein [Ralstonia sp. A12]KHK57599.1 ABC transporter permease [Ralstonia sp. A12]
MNARFRLVMAPVFHRLASLLFAAAAILVTAAPAHADMAKIRQSGALKVALYKGLPPFSDNAGGQFTGIDVALANALSKQMGLSASLLPFDADDDGMSGDLRNMVWRGHYLGYGPADVMLHVPVDPNFVRQNDQVLIFAPYLREAYVLVYDRERVSKVSSFEDLAGQMTGAEQGTGAASALLSGAHGALRDKVKIYPEANGALHALFSGEIAAAMVTRAQYESVLKAQNQSATRYVATELQSPLLPARGWAIGMAVKADQRELAQALENALNALRASGELQRIFAQYGVSMAAP